MRSSHKKCSKCGKTKPYSEFHKNSKAKDGHVTQCKACRAEYQRKYRQTEKGKATAHRYSVSEKGRAASKRYLESDKGRRAYHRYRKSSKGRKTLSKLQSRRYQWERNAERTLTAEQWLAKVALYTHCPRCGAKFNEENPATLDHIIPISRGGTHTAENVWPLCKSCNSKKGAR